MGGHATIHGASATETRSGGGIKWVPIKVGGDGAAYVTLSIKSAMVTRTLTIGADTDCFTDRTAPIAAELMTVGGLGTGKRRCRITWHSSALPAAIPYAAVVACGLNLGDDTTALSALKYVDVSVGDAADTDTRQELLSKDENVLEWFTDTDITRVDLGGWLPEGAASGGNAEVLITVRVW